MIDWNKMTREDILAISAIVRRARELDPALDTLTTQMNLEACHTHACRLDLTRMATAKPQDLMHDVYGVNRHLNRETGSLDDCFLPRFAARE